MQGSAAEDPTVDLVDLRSRNSVVVQLARVQANAEAGRVSQRLKAVGSLVGALAMLMIVVWYGGPANQDSGQTMQRAGAVVAQLVPVGVAAASDVNASTPVAVTGVDAPADNPVASTERAVIRPRDCMVQVESTILFRLIARDAPSRGAYDVAVNREIKRLALRHKVRQPRTLDLIASEVWADRSLQRTESPAQRTVQYQRCEMGRPPGAQYMVRAN